MGHTIDELTTAVEGQTVASVFLRTLDQRGGALALQERDESGERWVRWTFDDVGRDVARAAASLRELGVGPGDFVVLMIRNRVVFHLVDLATAPA